MRDPQETFRKLIEKQKTVYLSSVDEEGYPCTRAMLAPRKMEGIKTIYFTTNTSSSKIGQFRTNNKGCIYFCDRRFFRGLCLKGTIEVLEDPAIKEEIWQEGDTMYYSQGVTDPDYCVLKFTAEKARYYSNFKTKEVIVD